jgi:hypothetical protein
MKKLMIAAAAAAMIGGVQAACEDPVVPTADCAVVYNFKATLTTTVDKYGKITVKNDLGCGDYEKETFKSCYREKGKKTLNGYYYACECACDLADTDAFGLVLWDAKTKCLDEEAAIEWDILQTFGKKFDKVEAMIYLATADGEFFAAGMGSVDTKKEIVKSISGNIVGAVACDETCLDCCDEDFRFGSVCEDADILDEENTVAYGSWSLKYNSSLSKKLLKNSIMTLLPKGVAVCAE